MKQPDGLDPRVLGANIASARKRARLTQASLAELLGISRPTLVAIESGQRQPTEGQIVAIARETQTRVRDLLSLAAPDESITVRFRSVSGSKDVRAAIDALEEFGRRYATLEAVTGDRIARREPPQFLLDRVSNLERGAEDLATTERLRLGLGDGPLPDVRVVLEEDAGLRIFGLDELSSTRVSGIFIYSAEYGPVVGYNPGQDPRRIRWTLCHEYAHYLSERYQPEITLLHNGITSRKERREVFADAFAGRFLMPTTGISRRFHEMVSDAGGTFRVAHLLMLSEFFQVSFEAATKRLEEIGLVTRGIYQMLVEKGFKVLEAEEMLGINRHKCTDRLPVRYVLLATRLYSRGVISEGDVAAYFRTDRLSARQILQSVPDLSGEDNSAEPGLDTQVEIAG